MIFWRVYTTISLLYLNDVIVIQRRGAPTSEANRVFIYEIIDIGIMKTE